MAADPLLRRVERVAVLACLAMAALGWIVAGPMAAAAVLGGGVLSALSYASIASGNTALTGALQRAATPRAPLPDAAGPPPARRGRSGVRVLAKAVLRYALLVLLAYVMIARLRLHPVGVLAGVSSVVAAVAVEALRLLLKKS